MNEVSNLEVVGAFSDTVNSGGTSFILHLVGRTRSQSRAFYYRKFIGKQFHDGNWTPWTKITLDINADAVAPIVFQGRLHLIWPNLQAKQKPKAFGSQVDGSNIAAQGEGQKSDFLNEVRVMWSEHNPVANKWSKPRLSKSKAVDDKAPTPFSSGEPQDQPSTDPYHLRLEVSSSEFVSITVIKTDVPSTAGALNGTRLGTFKLWFTGDDTFEKPDSASAGVTFGLNYPVGTILKHNGAEEVS